MPERLSVTFMEVGWGDSILIESEDSNGRCRYALIDSNDTLHQPSSLLFLKRFFERKNVAFQRPAPRVFQFVLLTHAHADHAAGLPRLLRHFGADDLLYSASSPPSDPLLAQMVRYANRPGARLGATSPVHYGSPLGHIPFGPVTLEVLWPDPGFNDADENNHSVVLALTLKKVSFILTGDATADVWPRIIPRLPSGTEVFQVPHHGARNGTFDPAGATPWVSHFATGTAPGHLAISCHPTPHSHPNANVVATLASIATPGGGAAIRRTDLDYHLRFETDGAHVECRYTHA
jgi:beta-lactamase superfamily II metal-dependent hydrolase